MNALKLLLPRLRRLEGLRIIWYNLEKREPYVLQGVLLVSCEETMFFTSCLQNWLIGTRIELVDTPECYGLVFELAMLHQWPILSSLIEITSLGSQSHQLLNHRREHPLIPGHDLVLPGSLRLPKWKNLILKWKNLILICDSFKCIAVTMFCPYSLRCLNFVFAYFINLLLACNNKTILHTTGKCSITNNFTETVIDAGKEKLKNSVLACLIGTYYFYCNPKLAITVIMSKPFQWRMYKQDWFDYRVCLLANSFWLIYIYCLMGSQGCNNGSKPLELDLYPLKRLQFQASFHVFCLRGTLFQ